MITYTLNNNGEEFQYPSYMKRVDGFLGSNFFKQWIPNWTKLLGHFYNQPNILGIEIGCYVGDCAVFCAERIANGSNSIHICIDINDHEFLLNNISHHKNIKFIKGKSYNILKNMEPKTADYIC